MALSLIIAVAAFTQAGSAEPFNPTTYKSESGGTTLWVNPGEARTPGRGTRPTTYVLKKGDKEVWSKQLPFTLLDAGVSDAGVIGGYGYSASGGTEGTLDIVLLNEDGTVR